jgi:hypothetical protein
LEDLDEFERSLPNLLISLRLMTAGQSLLISFFDDHALRSGRRRLLRRTS